MARRRCFCCDDEENVIPSLFEILFKAASAGRISQIGDLDVDL